MPKMKMSYKEYLINKIPELKSGEYIILDDDFNYKSKVTMIHTKCGHKFYPTIKNFTNKSKGKGKGTRCPYCSHPSKPYDIDYVKRYLKKITFGEYDLLSKEYHNKNEKLLFRHNCPICNNSIFKMSFSNFKNSGNRCPSCFRILHSSKYHTYIRNFLSFHDIEFKEEVKFKSCKKEKCLPFDFYIPSLKLLIEYDGKQHERAWYNDPDKIKLTKDNDNYKNNWVKENSKYSLLRISEKNIEKLADIMEDLFINYDSTTIERNNLIFISSRVPSKLFVKGNVEQ